MGLTLQEPVLCQLSYPEDLCVLAVLVPVGETPFVTWYAQWHCILKVYTHCNRNNKKSRKVMQIVWSVLKKGCSMDCKAFLWLEQTSKLCKVRLSWWVWILWVKNTPNTAHCKILLCYGVGTWGNYSHCAHLCTTTSFTFPFSSIYGGIKVHLWRKYQWNLFIYHPAISLIYFMPSLTIEYQIMEYRVIGLYPLYMHRWGLEESSSATSSGIHNIYWYS